MIEKIRRVVTTQNEDGKSVFMIDQQTMQNFQEMFW